MLQGLNPISVSIFEILWKILHRYQHPTFKLSSHKPQPTLIDKHRGGSIGCFEDKDISFTRKENIFDLTSKNMTYRLRWQTTARWIQPPPPSAFRGSTFAKYEQKILSSFAKNDSVVYFSKPSKNGGGARKIKAYLPLLKRQGEKIVKWKRTGYGNYLVFL